MELVSIQFILTMFSILVLYYIAPIKFRKYVILIANFLFYLSFGLKNTILLTIMMLLSYFSGILLRRKKDKKIFVLCLIVVLLPLLTSKYLDFFLQNIELLTKTIGLNFTNVSAGIVAPIGVSFFTFKMISYISDCYTDKWRGDYSLFDYMIYISFFPTIMSGPIDRPHEFMSQLKKKHPLRDDNIKKGFAMIVWGYFQKMILADRLALIVNTVFENYSKYSGLVLFMTSIFYTIQIYCDFAGYTYIARGLAKTMGFTCMENFEQPYFAVSTKDFWRRWHISLSSWLRDYIYIPLGGNRKGKLRKHIHLMITFLVSGIWHGVGWKFILWGGLHGIYQILSDTGKNFREKIKTVLRISGSRYEKAIGIICTFLLVNFAWIIFWGTSLTTSLGVLSRIFVHPGTLSFAWIQECGISNAELAILFVAFVLLLVVDWLKERHIDLLGKFTAIPLVFRWFLLYTALFILLLFGVYGPGYQASQFIYFKF